MTDPQQLLREYVESSSDAAFRELVGRYIDLVYSVALRRTNNDTRIAEDIAQTVFTDLSRKASTLPPNVMLGGWLHRHTCFVAANAIRGEQRRSAREQQALEMNMLHDDSEENWKQLAPILDDAIQELAPAERDAVVLRFFEQRDFRSVGAALGVSDDTAQKRVSRALEKLRELLVQRGVTMGIVALGTALADRSVDAAPSQLSSSIANSVTHSSSTAAVASRSGRTARMMVGTAIVALLLVVALYPSVSAKLRSWMGSHAASQTPVTESVFKELPAPTELDTVTDAAGTNAAIRPAEVEGIATVPNTNVLTLTIVAEDSGRPVPNVPVDVRCQAGGKWKYPKVIANRMGIAEVPLFENTTHLQVTTQIEGFADTRLTWSPERGQMVPSSYTIHLIRPVQIGGTVIGPDNEPVAGAKVGFNHRDDPLTSPAVESHHFTWIEVTTDSAGKWQINRIAPELIRRIYGSAKHPEYAASGLSSVDRDPEMEQALKAGTYVFKMGEAMSVRGIVQDSEGNPIADAKVLCGEIGMSDRRETKSGKDGTFSIKGVKAGKTVLSAETKGLAATTIPIEISNENKWHTLTLVPGKTLRMRVVNIKGEPVAKAYVWLNTMSHNLPKEDEGKVTVQARFDKRTDAEGRIVWDNAPDSEHTFDIAGDGCMRLNNVKMQPSEEEHVVTLQPALLVSGTVKDAESGKDIQKFRVICGWPGQDGPHWSNFDRDWLTFEGGKFKHSFDEPLIFGMENPGYQVKVEAEGYTPYVSRAMTPTEDEVTLEISLKPATTPLITVLLPNGQPATMADVGFVAPNGRLEMMPGGFDRHNVQNAAALSQTDRKGQFRLLADDDISQVVIAHPQGCVERTPNDLVNNSIVYLQPWGRLEGTYHSGDKAIEGREFTLEFGFAKADAISYSFSKRVKTDANGKFVFPQVIPGQHKLIMLIHQKIDGKSGYFQNREMQEVEIESGQTTTVELGGDGNVVQMKLQFPHGTDRRGIRVIAAIHTPYPRPPKEIMMDQQALQVWRETPEIMEQRKRVKNFPFIEQPDGTWLAENVSPGEYSVMINAHRRVEGSQTAESWHGGKANVTISEDSSAETLDLGEIVLKTPEQFQP